MRLLVDAYNFEINPSIVQMIQQNQFGGLPNKDLHVYLSRFQICDTFKMNEISKDAVKLRLYSFSLLDKAISSLDFRPAGSFTTWQILLQAFLTQYFPLGKMVKLRNEINIYYQKDKETLYEV